MKISLFSGNSAENTRLVSNEVDFDPQLITESMWSPCIYQDGLRTNLTFLNTDLLVLDIDEGMTLQDASQLFSEYNHIIGTTRSHQKEKNGAVCDRFRVILPLDEMITNLSTFKTTWHAAAKLCPSLDRQCSDAARFYFPCSEIIEQVTDKTNFPISKAESVAAKPIREETEVEGKPKGKISARALKFLTTGAQKGTWHGERNNFIRECKQNNYTYDEMLALFCIHHKPDATDEFQFKDVWSRGVKHEPRFAKTEANPLVSFIYRSKMIINVEDIDDYKFADLQTGAAKRLDKRAVAQLLGREGFKEYQENNTVLAHFAYKPTQTSPLYVDEIGMTTYNQYQPPKWLENLFYFGQQLEPLSTIPPIYETFISHLTDNDKASADYLIDWLATSLQGRNLTLLTAIGEQGIGKGTLGEIMERLHGETNFARVRDQVFKDKFNAPLKNKTLVYVDEIDLQTKESQDRIKDVVNARVEIEQKGVDPHSSDNFASFYLSSNSLDAIKIEGGDRRFSVIQLTSKKITETDLSGARIDELKTPENIELLARYLRFKKVERNMYTPFRSNRYEEVREATLQDWELFLVEDWAPKNKGKSVLLSEMKLELELSGTVKHVPGRPKLMKLIRKYPEILSMKKKTNNQWYVTIV